MSTSKNSLGYGHNQSFKSQNSQQRSRKLYQSKSRQAILQETAYENEETPLADSGVQNSERRRMRK